LGKSGSVGGVGGDSHPDPARLFPNKGELTPIIGPIIPRPGPIIPRLFPNKGELTPIIPALRSALRQLGIDWRTFQNA
jgi:hypothetical protein